MGNKRFINAEMAGYIVDKFSEIILYQTEDGKTKLEVRLEHESVWLIQAAMAELFQTTPQNITFHLKDIYNTRELLLEATCKENLQVQNEGGRQVKRASKFYNLPAIITVGYRVNSSRGTQFRQWAAERLNEYLVKCFIMYLDYAEEQARRHRRLLQIDL